MTISQAIAPHLPYLRRFARALTGSQASGDAYAVATLEAIIAAPTNIDAGADVRVSLYKVFLQVWGSIPLNTGKDDDRSDGEGISGVSRAAGFEKLGALTPRPRVAFILNAIEGFEPEQVAKALGCDVTEALELIDTAGIELANQLATQVLIIEDEPIIAMDIEALVESLGHSVSEIARTHREALQAVKRLRPGLILADIQLADGSSGLDAVNDILQSFAVPVIFITAYPERLLTGQRPEPAFMITKPFRPDMVKAVISQALFFDQKSTLPPPNKLRVNLA